MKKNIIIFFAIFATLLSSCAVDNPFEEMLSRPGTTKVTFSPDFGANLYDADTRAFSHNPQVENLYLAVFTEDGKALVEYVKANPVAPATTNSDDKYTYTATLKQSDEPRVIHFIANGPEELNYGSEEDAIGSLLYSFDKSSWTGKDAYWGYLELPNGICDSKSSAYSTLTTALSSVKLVRNFAKIRIATTTDKLEVTRFWVSNFPDRSSAAPYNRIERGFEMGYANYDHASTAMAAGYNGFCPASSGLVSISGLSPDKLNAIACAADTTAYIYECEKPVKDPLCIVVGGYFDGSSTETYYKLEIRDADGKYIPVLRNFTYTITIGEVKKAGEASVEDALKSIPSGGIDTNLDLQDLQDLSNGRSRIAVSTTDMVVVNSNALELRYLFMPDITNGVIVNTTLEQWLASGYADEAAVQADHKPYVTITSEPGTTGKVIDSFTVASSDDANDHYRPISMTPLAISDIVKTEVFTVMGHVYNSTKGEYETIQRTVNVQMRQRPLMTLKLTPNKVLGKTVGDSLSLTIGIEANLPKSLFTLEMKIETEQMTLTPSGNDLPVSSGIGTDGKPNYFMTKAITWEDYCKIPTVIDKDGVARKHITCGFLTNTNVFYPIPLVGQQGDRVWVTSKVFSDASVIYLTGNNAFNYFVDPHFDKPSLAAGRPAHIVFGMTGLPEDGTVFVRMMGIEPVDRTALVWQRDDGDYSVYQMHVSDINSESAEIIAKAGANLCYFQLIDDDFNPSGIYSIEVKKLQFYDLHLGLGTNDYVVVGRDAQASFKMSNTPKDSTVTIHLKNCTPKDNTLTGTPESDGYTAYVIPAKTEQISFPVTINTGVYTASFKLSDDEFDNSGEESADVKKLQFTGPAFINGSLGYLLSNGTGAQQIQFTLGDRPTTGTGNVILYLKGVTVNGMTSTGTGTGTYAGYDKYELNMADATAYPNLTVTLGITPKSGATSASARLSHPAEFDDSAVATVDIKTRYTIDWSKVLIKSDESGNPAQGGVSVSVYTTYNSSTGTCSNAASALGSYQTFTTTNTTGNKGYASATTTQAFVDAANGTDKFYFKFTKGGVDYISEEGVTLATLAKTTTVPQDVEVICKIQMQTYNFAASTLTFQYIHKSNGQTKSAASISIGVYKNGKTSQVTTITTNINGQNSGVLKLENCKQSDEFYFQYASGPGGVDYWAGPIKVTEIANSTITLRAN